MRSILEKAFVALLNEDHDKAEEMFHKFIVERARQIHESNRAGEDYVLDENWNDEITTESYFTEDDLSDLEDDDMGDEAGEEDFGADDTDDMDADAGEDMPMDDGMGDEEIGDEEGEGTPEERIDHLEDQIEKLTAEFEAMMDSIGDDEGVQDDDVPMDDDDMGGDEFGDEDEADNVEDDMDGTDELPAMESEEEDDVMESDEFDDITESIIDELEKVSVSMVDGKEIGDGKTFKQNITGAALSKAKDARQAGAPVVIKSSTHKGYERETPPHVDEMKTRRNTLKKADSVLVKVSKEGNKAAEINKLSSENGNTKSIVQQVKK